MTASNIAIREFLKSRPIRQPQGVALADAVIVAPLAAIGLRARPRLCSRSNNTVAAVLVASRSKCGDCL
jgi:hypothetical protein